MSNKRKSPSRHHSIPKRPRIEDDHTNSPISRDSRKDINLPDLPVIDQKYQGPVFTHPSLASQEKHIPGEMVSYDRLEFLGDAYIELIATRLIFERYQFLPVGRMSSVRESLVKNETLSKYSILYQFDQKLKKTNFPHNEKSTSWTKILGDVFEAYIAAIILSDPLDGYKTAEQWLHQLWEPKLQESSLEPENTNSKQELAKRILTSELKINYVDERPPLIQKSKGIETYYIGVYVTGCGMENRHLGSGTGTSKSAAGMKAASNALQQTDLIDQLAAKKQDYVQRKRQAEAAKEKAEG